MHDFQDAPLVGPGSELQLTLDGRAVAHRDVVCAEGGPEPSSATAEGELVDAVLAELEVGEETDARELDLPLAPAGAREENLYVAGERLAARAASSATRKQYASIYRTFGDWLRAEYARADLRTPPPSLVDIRVRV